MRLEQQAEFIEFVKSAPGYLRRGAVADQMCLQHKAFAFEAAKRFTDRRVGYVELLDQTVDGDP